ncbi:phage tail tape measure protein [Streptomyces canus]|uniref:phage tail tape measure protein n=1 Tax=Streptomyces canus TaxID=58343 RepID=UPI000375D210|nr:phage tail tape measure protein [Streptomyces canus]
MGALPPVFIEFLGHSKGVKTAIGDVKAEMAVADEAGAGAFKKTGLMAKAAVIGLGIAAAGVAIKTAKMAGDFEQQMTRVRTGAGESAKNMGMVGQGVLAMAGQVGQSTDELTKGLYMTESAGYHGANALKVLKTAAMGAKVGAADLNTTTDAATTAMNAYHTGASSVTDVMNSLIATEAEGKTNLEALAGSMSTILPVAAAAHVGLHEVLGAMATMTAQGTPAAVAATYLRQTIGQLSNPSNKAATEMKNLGLSAVQVGQNLGKKGLASTLTMLTDAIQKKMGPAGTVLIRHLQGASKNTTEFQRALANLPPQQQTYVGALATMVGGTKSMQAALQLTGPHMKDFIKNTQGIDEHVKKGGKSVEGWADVQKNFNQKMAEAKASAQALGIQVGQFLLPAFQAIMGVVAKVTSFLAAHRNVAKALAIVIGVILVAAIAAMTAALYGMAAAAAVNPVTWIVLGVMALIAAIIMLAMHWKTVWGFVKQIAGDVGRFVVGLWHTVANGTASVWRSIVDWVKGAWHAIASFFTAAWHMAVDPLVHGWQMLWRITMTVWNAISGFFKKWWPLLLVIFATPIAILISLWNHTHKTLEAGARAIWNGIASFFKAVWSGIKAVAGLVWAGIQVAVITPMMSLWGALKAGWHTISGWLKTAWGVIRSFALTVWSGIKIAIINPLIATWHAISSTMSNIGKAIMSGLKTVLGWAKSFVSSFVDVGTNIVKGIIHGVESMGSSLFGSVKNIAKGALDAAKNFLGIKSPSRKFAEIGAYVGAGLIQGLTGSTARVKSAANRIAQMLYREFGSSGHRHLQALVRRDGAELVKLANQRDRISARLKAANKKLGDLQKAWKKTRDDVASSVMQNVSVVTALPEGSVELTSQDVVANMRAQVARAKKFAADLTKLRKMHLSADLIKQIADSGVDQGGATAAALASGNTAQIAEINKLQGQAKAAAGKVGSATADSMYKAGIDSAKGLIRGLHSQQKNIAKAMEHIAKAMANAIKRALKIHSPSQVFHEIGDFITQGLANGINAGTRTAQAAAHAMAGAVSAAGMPTVPKLATGRMGFVGAAVAGAAYVDVPIVVQLDGDVLFKKMQRRTLQHERRNTSNGLSAKTR